VPPLAQAAAKTSSIASLESGTRYPFGLSLSPPFGLSLSKPRAALEQHFDKLSANGFD